MADLEKYPLLATIGEPSDLRKLDAQQLKPICEQLRGFLIDSVAETGGHLGASLGTIELTAALHYVYETPKDILVWDVGHQTYPHKILTGRARRMNTMRKQNGLAGFPKREESEYDSFGVGHSSTSISAATGMALAARAQGRDEKIVAVIGDGAMTAGMAFEALNHAGGERLNMLVILNDNDMSISPNVGALNKYLARILSGKLVTGAREGSKRVLKHVPSMLELARKTEEHVKGMVVPCSLFEELGFNYYGPVDGHDVNSLVDVLSNLRALPGPVFLHVVTQKGRGYKFAEQDPLALHATTPFDTTTGKKLSTSSNNQPTYTNIFGQWLCDMAAQDERVVGITPAMREGSGLVEFEQQFPDRYFDVGIAEQHSVTLAAGLACGGMKPVVAIYSTFLQRGYDQLIHDIAIQNLPVVFAIDRAGLVGQDGPTHAGAFDLTFLRCLPNMIVMAPADENDCRQMLYTAHLQDGPCAVRYPKGTGPGAEVQQEMQALEIGKAEVRHHGQKIALLAFGSMVARCQRIGEELDATVVNMRFVKPIDTELISDIAATHDLIITVEENAVAGGAGAAVLEWLSAQRVSVATHVIGLPDCYIDHGSREEMLEVAELDEPALRRRITTLVAELPTEGSVSRSLHPPISSAGR